MPKVRVSAFAISLDGYGAGPRQDIDNPLGVSGPDLFEWFFATRAWRQIHGKEGEAGGRYASLPRFGLRLDTSPAKLDRNERRRGSISSQRESTPL
jgi:hypothetical protein